MTDSEQTSAFGDELDKLIDRFREEFDLTYAQLIGTLHFKIHLLCNEAERNANNDHN